MKTFTIVATLFLASLPQAFDNIPPCAQGCIRDAIKSSTTCSETDIPCTCANKDAIQIAGTSCVVSSCGLDVALSKKQRDKAGGKHY